MTGAVIRSAIVVAGGRARRMQGTAKPLLDIDGRTLLEIAVEAARSAGADNPIVVGPAPAPAGTSLVREDPPFGGPVAALGAALPLVTGDHVLVLAADLPRAHEAVEILRAAGSTAADGVALRDADRHPQWLLAVYRTAALRNALGTLPDQGRDASLRELLASLTLTFVDAPRGVTDDVDTWEDLREARTARASKERNDR